MPLYLYACPDCEIVLEERRAMEMADWPPVECPVCHGLCERQMALVNVIRHHASDREVEPAGVPILHGPDCPCCGGFRRA
jgi:putative FmdB family regulatory protein